MPKWVFVIFYKVYLLLLATPPGWRCRQFSQYLPSPVILLMATLMGGEDNDNADGAGGNGDNNKGQVAQALPHLVLGSYSVQVCWLWRVFYLDYL
jgi:hypothetical protein